MLRRKKNQLPGAQDTNYVKFIYRHREQMPDAKAGKGIGVSWQIGTDLCALTYTTWRRKWQPIPVLSGKYHA